MKSILSPPHLYACQSKENLQDQVSPYESVSLLTGPQSQNVILNQISFSSSYCDI